MSQRTRGRDRGERAGNTRRNTEDRNAFGDRQGYLKADAELAKIGLGLYQVSSGKDGAAKLHSIHVLESHPDDPNLIGLGLYGHRDVGVHGDNFLCPREMRAYLGKQDLPIPPEIEDGRCPMCERHDILLVQYKKKKDKVPEKVRKQLWDELRKHRAAAGKWNEPGPVRYLTWVVDATDRDTEDEGVKIFLMPPTVHDKGIAKKIAPTGDRKGRDPLDPDNGYIFEFEREGKEWHEVEYGGYGLGDRDSIPDEWVEAVPRYFDALNFVDYDTIRTAMESMGTDEEEGDGDDAEARRGSRRRSRVDEDEDEEDDRPRRRSRRDRDDEDDDPPKRRSRRDEPPEDDDPDAERRRAEKEIGDHFDDTNPKRKRKRDEDDEPEDDERPKQRRRREPAANDDGGTTSEEVDEIRRRREARRRAGGGE